MKRLAFLLLAVSPLLACAVPEETDDQAGNAAATADESRAADGTDGTGGSPSAREEGGAPIRGKGAGERASRPADREAADPDGPDACGASRYQHLVGRPRSAIPAEPAGATWRIACTSCPITMDYSPARLNLFYDEETQIVEEVRCG